MAFAPLIAGGIAAVGSIVSGISQNSAAKANAKASDNAAEVAQDQAARRADAIRQNAHRLRGEQSAAYGASGVTQEGSPFSVMQDSEYEAELDALTATYEGKIQADSLKAQGRAQRRSGHEAVVAGVVGAGTAALSGYGNWKIGQSMNPGATVTIQPQSGIRAPNRFGGVF